MERVAIALYEGEGAGDESCRILRRSLRRELDPRHRLMTVDHRDIQAGRCFDDAALLIMPGGRDLPYHERLKGRGNANILRFVQEGGKYLGLCAGGYYGTARVEFDEGRPLQVVGDRELAFFPGIGRGPVSGKGTYVYDSLAGARATWVQWNEENGLLSKRRYPSYYNGGGCFVGAEGSQTTRVLARYADMGTDLPAIVECEVGLGTALLTGIHPEVRFDDLGAVDLSSKDEVGIAGTVREALRSVEEDRCRLFRGLLLRLGLQLRPPGDDNTRLMTWLRAQRGLQAKEEAHLFLTGDEATQLADVSVDVPYFRPLMEARQQLVRNRLHALLSAGSFEQTLLIGAGYDTHAGFLSAHGPAYEVDRPEVMDFKARLLAEAGRTYPAHLVGVDLVDDLDQLIPRLRQNGFRTDRKVLATMEGVLYYIEADLRPKVLDTLARLLAPGSILLFDVTMMQDQDMSQGSGKFMHDHGMDLSLDSEADWCQLLNRHGFVPRSMSNVGFTAEGLAHDSLAPYLGRVKSCAVLAERMPR